MNHPDDEKKSKNSGWLNWFQAFLIVAALLLLYKLISGPGFAARVGLASPNITLGLAFLIGIAASFSTCLAVVGGVVIAFSQKYRSEERNFFKSALRPNLLFQLGRLVAFFILGGLLGLIGGRVNISGNFVSIYTMIVAVILGWVGLNILGIVPSLSALGVRPPKIALRYWDRIEASDNPRAPIALGALTFFLPCGFTQSMQIFALVSGSFWTGAMSLFLFALGTLPMLVVLGATASWIKMNRFTAAKYAIGIVLVIFSIFTFRSGFSLLGVKSDVISATNEEQPIPDERTSNQSSQNIQNVEMRVTARGFEPNVFKVKKNMPVKWVIKGEQVTGCTNKIIIPSLDISKNLSYGENIVEFTPVRSGEIVFSCGMGMVRGKFVVE